MSDLRRDRTIPVGAGDGTRPPGVGPAGRSSRPPGDIAPRGIHPLTSSDRRSYYPEPVAQVAPQSGGVVLQVKMHTFYPRPSASPLGDAIGGRSVPTSG